MCRNLEIRQTSDDLNRSLASVVRRWISLRLPQGAKTDPSLVFFFFIYKPFHQNWSPWVLLHGCIISSQQKSVSLSGYLYLHIAVTDPIPFMRQMRCGELRNRIPVPLSEDELPCRPSLRLADTLRKTKSFIYLFYTRRNKLNRFKVYVNAATWCVTLYKTLLGYANERLKPF